MGYSSYSSSDQAQEDRIRKELKNVEVELERLRLETNRVNGEKQKLLDELKEINKRNDEENLLAKVYRQRRGI